MIGQFLCHKLQLGIPVLAEAADEGFLKELIEREILLLAFEDSHLAHIPTVVIMVTLGTGVGGGIVIGGKLYSGFNYAGAELGHIVIEHGGRPCTCGRKGCWEAYSSATALIEFTKEKMAKTRDTVMWELCENGAKKVSGRTAFKAARAGDKAGQEVVDTYIDYLACGITNMVNIFQPQVLCIGGGVCGEGDYLLTPLKEIVDRDQYGSSAHDDKTQIKIAQLGNDAGILGAALLGI